MDSEYDSDTDSIDSAGTLSTDDGEIFVKPATRKEIAFYDEINISTQPEYKALASLCPTYYGSLEFTPEHRALIKSVSQESFTTGKTPGEGHHEMGQPLPKKQKHQNGQSEALPDDKIEYGVALEALTNHFKEPNTLDVKLGAILYDEIAKEGKKWEKIVKFRHISNTTTSKNLSFRFAGMKLFQGHEVQRPSEWVDKDGFHTYGKDWGQSLQDGDVHDAFREYLFHSGAGVDAELGAYVAEGFLKEVEKMVKALENVPLRMYSSSILFVYEGDGDRLREAIQAKKRGEGGREIFKCKLIDFAHATIGEKAVADHEEPIESSADIGSKIDWVKVVPKKQIDENTLNGIRNVARILKEVKDKGPLSKAESKAMEDRVNTRIDAKANTKKHDEAEFKRLGKKMKNEAEAADKLA